jgi:hypothetical protein
MAIAGEHMIRYTREAVLPRLEMAIEEVRRETSAAAAQQRVALDVARASSRSSEPQSLAV